MSSHPQKRWVIFLLNNATLDFSFIRPNSSYISAKGFKKMMNIDDVVQEKEK